MEVKSAEIVEIRNSTVDSDVTKIVLQFNNGFNIFKLRITKKNLNYDDLLSCDELLTGFAVKVVFYARNCCKNSPTVLLNSENQGDRKEIVDIINKCLEIKGEDIRAAINKMVM